MPFFQARPFFNKVENPKGMAGPKESVGTVSVLYSSSVKGQVKQLVPANASLLKKQNHRMCVQVFHTHEQHHNSCCAPKSLSYPAI